MITLQYRDIKSGPGICATNMVNNLSKWGHKITVITPPNNIEREDVRFIFVPVSRFDPTPHKWLSFSYNAAHKYKMLEGEHFDIVHFTDAKEAFFFPLDKVPMVGKVNGYSLAMATKNPLYYRKFYPADWIRRYFYENFAKFLERRALLKLKAIIANCEFVPTMLHKFYHIPPNKMHVIYNSIDLDRFKEKNLRRGRKKEGPIILLVGGNFQRKGLPLIIKAAPRVLEQYPSAQFHVIGHDPNVNKMRKLCRKERVDKAFQFLGYVNNEDIGDYYKLADVFVMPSLAEALGTVFLEAMASGTPVIGGNVGGTKELIQDGKNGLLVEATDYDQLAEQILRLLNDRKLRTGIIEEGYKTVRNYDMNKMLDETVSFYGKVLGMQFNTSS